MQSNQCSMIQKQMILKSLFFLVNQNHMVRPVQYNSLTNYS